MLLMDPFSDSAYRALIGSHARGQRVDQGSEEELRRAWLGINPKASGALAAAAAGSRDLTVATMFLGRMGRDDCLRAAAVGNLALKREPAEQLALLDEHAPSYPAAFLDLIRMEALRRRGRRSELAAHLNAEVRKRIERHLTIRDPSYAASWNHAYASALLELGEPAAARAVVEDALLRAPDDKALAQLLRKLPRSKPTAATP